MKHSYHRPGCSCIVSEVGDPHTLLLVDVHEEVHRVLEAVAVRDAREQEREIHAAGGDRQAHLDGASRDG